jgi:hypothetical protein
VSHTDEGKETLPAINRRRTLQAGRKLSLDDYRLRLLQREEAKNRLAAIAPLADALISLGSPGPATRGLGSTGDSVFNSLTSILGAPAVTVPMLAIEGMPVGIQIVVQRHADARTAGIARWLLETMSAAQKRNDAIHRCPRTGSSNPPPSSAESANFWFLKLRNRYPEPEHVLVAPDVDPKGGT